MGFKTHSTRWNQRLVLFTGEELGSEWVIGTPRDLLLICWMHITLASLYLLIFIPETSAAPDFYTIQFETSMKTIYCLFCGSLYKISPYAHYHRIKKKQVSFCMTDGNLNLSWRRQRQSITDLNNELLPSFNSA